MLPREGMCNGVPDGRCQDDLDEGLCETLSDSW